ncbi:terpenoid synthase [Cerioporus squamosus]|nr:terpenoid synthase [Cerioporus squamosus]
MTVVIPAPPSPVLSGAALPPSDPDHFILPDLVGHCNFPLAFHPHGYPVSAESVQWLDSGCPELSSKARGALYGLQAGELTAFCYPYCSADRLRVGTEELADTVMNALWFPDRYMPTEAVGREQPAVEASAGKLARDFWTRCTRDAKPGIQARFKENVELFFETVNQQARDRDAQAIPDFESYISMRRDTSGCKPTFDLIEYAMDIDLPEFVVRHPVIHALNQGANDLVTDIFSYNVEQSRGDTHNMIVILMQLRGFDLQTAVDFVGELCRQTIDTFVENQRNVPSFGPKLDRDVAMYIQGLQDWIVGSLHWSFMTERYFGQDGADVKRHRVVKLLPRRTPCTHT